MTRLTLPSGAYAEMRDPGTLKAKHRKQVMRAIKAGDRLGGELIDSLDGIIAVLVVDWDACDAETGARLPLPNVSLDSLDEISDADYEALCGAAEVKDLAQRIMKVRTGAVEDNPDGHDDPASPTAPSDASTPGSTEGSRKPGARSPKSTRSSKPSGLRTATAGTKTKSAS
jgi:hypothetical protein